MGIATYTRGDLGKQVVFANRPKNTSNIDLLKITRVYVYDIVSAKLALYIELELEGNVTVLCTWRFVHRFSKRWDIVDYV